MSQSARQLFQEVADLSHAEREKVFAERGIPPAVRAEVESLLHYDATSGETLEQRVSDLAEEVLRWRNGPASRQCGPYRLVRPLGSGGMGAVYLAQREDGEIEQQVAIKLLRADADKPAFRERFLRERQLLAYLSHPSIARLLDAGRTEDGRPYLVMEHVEGTAIDQYATGLEIAARLQLFILVCEGVSHAHRQLIIHRDLKPSNILVDAGGYPKLLDFGIAKLLDVSDQTRTVERLLTPNYASPEQLRGEFQTTATDIFSLGAVLYKLLTGRSPREALLDAPPVARVNTAGAKVRPPSQLNPKVPRDLDFVLRKALRDEPAARYVSVDALADDVRAVLDRRPVAARGDDTWYRTGKVLRRYWAPFAAGVITLAGLSFGMYQADRQRAAAQEHLRQIREIANKVLALDGVVGALPGSTKARSEIVAMSKDYLETLAAKPRDDQELALELGAAYIRMAQAQGIPGSQNLGRYSQAEESLWRAAALVEPVVRRDPYNRRALLELAGINQGLMNLSRHAGRRDQALMHARSTVRQLDTLLAIGQPSVAELTQAADNLYTVAYTYRNLHRHDEALAYARRSAQLARALPASSSSLIDSLSLIADLTRIGGDFEGALKVIREARATLATTQFPSERRRVNSWFTVLWREGVILGGGNGVSLNRPDEAVAVLERAVELIEGWAGTDPNDASVRLLFDQTARELGTLLRDRDPRRALAIYDLALRRLREVADNPAARRGEAGMLAGSSYALRRLGRADEARRRIEEAFRLLRQTNDYPADRIDTDSEAEPALRALGDYYAETGQPVRAAEVYHELLDKVMAAKPDSLGDLRRAAKLSRIFENLAALYRRNGRLEESEALAARRRDLWHQWEQRLPANSYVKHQLANSALQSRFSS